MELGNSVDAKLEKLTIGMLWDNNHPCIGIKTPGSEVWVMEFSGLLICHGIGKLCC